MNKGDTFNLVFKISEDLIMKYAELSGDFSKVHMDNEFARAIGFSERIAHGNILGLQLSRLVGQELPLKNVVIQKQEMTFYNPVYIGDTVTLTAQVVDFYESVNTFEIKCLFVNQKGVKVCNAKLMIGKI